MILWTKSRNDCVNLVAEEPKTSSSHHIVADKHTDTKPEHNKAKEMLI